MSLGKKYRESAAVIAEAWARNARRRALPPCCNVPIGLGHAEAIYAGSMVEQMAGNPDDASNVASVGIATAGLLRWREAGHPQFALTASAAAAFVLTDTAGLRWGDVKLPFDDFVIFMPSPSPIVFDDFDGRERAAQVIMVSHCLTPTVSSDEITAVLQAHQQAWRAGRPPAELRAILDNLKEVPTLWVQAESETADGIHRFYTKHLDPTQTLGDWCDPEVPGAWQSDRSRFAMGLVCRIVACLALYLDHTDGPEQRWDPNLLARNRAQGRATTTWNIGQEIKLPRELREAARLLGRSEKNPAPWTVQSRMLVRGHWRNQACGKGRAERRKQWISPYWKGAEVGAVVDKLYKIGAE